ncbi:deoxyribonuclease [Aneurinibacillus migulanus]|uniref:TatD family hydrolase n=1 Tax=Aneurinibacillus migulanus TaxID=47500 RepID=UPI0005BA3D7E|nr:TatD family hydrolase [Aneurinibacillus migulanus]KIV56838.1 deoxyribonuclease [Aneurinibacillus migulanus]KPD08569.1 deoxyribonuclease [Aneurinibacillus migulanus]MED4731931.1 TatD family hydrolase [Aneurinibacillus migulanus]CEH29006.1 Sec-independent secretion TatD [Aneurinibacillus migulanus]
MECIDAHLHLDQYPESDTDKLISEWRKAGITGVVAVSMNLASAYRTLELKRRYPDFVYAAVGYHPEQSLPSLLEREELFSLLRKEREMIDAVGEVGLPHYQADAVKETEAHCELLDQFAEVAVELALPLALHAVHDKAQIALDILLKKGVCKAHFHWLKAPNDVVEKIVRHGYYVSITPEICYRERDRHLACRIPLSQLLLETDGPWPHNGPFAGQVTTPVFLRRSVTVVAELHDISVEAAAAASVKATRDLYGYK